LNDERRADQRIPYFHTASVQVDHRSYTAFIREISDSSIGLLHNVELPLKDAEIRFARHGTGFLCESNGASRAAKVGMLAVV